MVMRVTVDLGPKAEAAITLYMLRKKCTKEQALYRAVDIGLNAMVKE
jgi:hypothetical protein